MGILATANPGDFRWRPVKSGQPIRAVLQVEVTIEKRAPRTVTIHVELTPDVLNSVEASESSNGREEQTLKGLAYYHAFDAIWQEIIRTESVLEEYTVQLDDFYAETVHSHLLAPIHRYQQSTSEPVGKLRGV